MADINILSLSLCAIVSVILIIILKSTGSTMGTCISIAVCMCAATMIFYGLINIYLKLNTFAADINSSYIKLMIKIVTISYITEISSGICKENGFGALASIMEIYARISVVGLCFPIVINLVEIVNGCL